MKKVYVCAPLRGDIDENLERVSKFGRYVLYGKKCSPVIPHYFSLFLDDRKPEERNLGIGAGMRQLEDCDELWIFGSAITEGMRKEIAFAFLNKIDLRHFDDDMVKNILEVY